jgi:uncharacterized protein (UPF0332 family)
VLDENKVYLSKHRLASARESLEEGELLLGSQKYKGANNRAYYTIFHSMRAILALDGFDSKKHSGVIAKFNESYIKNKIFTIDYGKIVKNASIIRNNSDYDDFFIATKEQAETQIKDAKKFILAVEKYLDKYF